MPQIVANLRGGPFAHLPAFTPRIRKEFFDSSKITAHHAVIPTTVRADMGKLSADEARCYLLIAGHYLACLMEDFTYLHTALSMRAGGVEFSASGIQPLKPGWKAALAAPAAARKPPQGMAAESQEDEPDADEAGEGEGEVRAFPPLADGTPARVEKAAVRPGKTRPPAHYTEKTLIGDMENIARYVEHPQLKEKLRTRSVEGSEATRDIGIGTPATRAETIKTLHSRQYVGTKGRKIRSTEWGQSLFDILHANLPALLDPGVTAVWEIEQERIIQGRSTVAEFMTRINRQNEQMVALLRSLNPAAANAAPAPPRASAEATDALCPKSKRPALDMGKYYRFEGWPKAFFWKQVAARPMTAAEYAALLSAPNLTSPAPLADFKTREGKPFAGRLVFHPKETEPAKQFTFWRPPAPPTPAQTPLAINAK